MKGIGLLEDIMEKLEGFRRLGLSEEILDVIMKFGFHFPTEIQEKSIPSALKKMDIVGKSATGSGKTLAFGAPIAENVIKGRGLQALVLTPTRELAEQVTSSLRDFSKHKNINVVEVYGGVPINNQIRRIRTAEVVVGTPGRILDHLGRLTMKLNRLHILVLDEADRMVDMGFLPDVEKIIKSCPKNRQTLLFSATISQDVHYIEKNYMSHPIRVSAEPLVDASKLEQVYYDVPNELKFSLLVRLLEEERKGLVMVFCNTRRNVDLLARNLKKYGLYTIAIHGGLNQVKRTKTMQAFRGGQVNILICTDVAARGLDILNVSHIYNYDSPKNSTEYIHRIGRTARAGKEGKAISLVSRRDYENFRNVNEDSSLNIKKEVLPKLDKLKPLFTDAARTPRGGRRITRRSGKRKRRFRWG